MKFMFAWKKGNVIKLQIILDSGEQKWADTTEEVCSYAQKLYGKDKIEAGVECGFEYTEKDGKYNITKIIEGGTSSKKEDTPPTTKYTCEDCKKELKDDKYKKCYECNKKNPSTSTAKNTCSDCSKELKDDKYQKCYECNKKNPVTKSTGSKSSYGNPTPEEGKRKNKLSVLSSVATAMTTLTGQIGDIKTVVEHLKVGYKELYKELFGE